MLYLLNKHVVVEVGGILSDTIVTTTDNERSIVREKPTFSPLSAGRMKTNSPRPFKKRTGSIIFRR